MADKTDKDRLKAWFKSVGITVSPSDTTGYDNDICLRGTDGRCFFGFNDDGSFKSMAFEE